MKPLTMMVTPSNTMYRRCYEYGCGLKHAFPQEICLRALGVQEAACSLCLLPLPHVFEGRVGDPRGRLCRRGVFP
jgi:hypothetical protein